MRTRPFVGTKPWFGPKRFGWGWSPASWEGWVATALLLAVMAVADRLSGLAKAYTFGAGVALLFVVIVVKGTSAGGAKQYKELRRRQRGGPYVHGGGDDTPSLEEVNRHYDEVGRSRAARRKR